VPDRRRAWARALFLAAPSREARSAYAEALEALSLAMAHEGRLREFLSDPSVSKAKKSSIVAAALEPGAPGVSAKDGPGVEVFERFSALVVEKGRSHLLPQIARSYCELRDADEGIARLEVEAARDVPTEALDRIAQAWTANAGVKTTRAKVRINADLIAGYRLRAGSLRIDYSVAGRLERLRRELARPLGRASSEAPSPGGAARGEG
jgi:F-type H+-transporting ATPase subunit delta